MITHKKSVDPIFKQLSLIRQDKEIKQTDLSVALGYSMQSISNWETGRHDPSWFGFRAWLDGLGYDVRLVKKDKS